MHRYRYCDLLLDTRAWRAARERAEFVLLSVNTSYSRLDEALAWVGFCRGRWGEIQEAAAHASVGPSSKVVSEVSLEYDKAVSALRYAATIDQLPRGLHARASFCRGIGNWDGAARDLDEIEEIAEPGPMRLFLCDMALERARLALAQIEAFAPLNGMLEKDHPPKPVVPSAEESAKLKEEAAKQIKIADDYIQTCGYHRRDEELTELQAVLRGEKKFAELPPRV
jgi:hypothetical protein